MLFFTLSNIKINLLKLKFFKKIYIFMEAISTIYQIKLIGIKKFADAVFDIEKETHVVYVASFAHSSSYINLF